MSHDFKVSKLDLVYRNLPVVLVFLTDFLFAWVWGGTRAEPLVAWMPWVTLLAVQTLFFFPQRHGYEDVVSARRRVWEQLTHDPLTWVTLAFFALLLIPLVNKGLCFGCDAAAIRAGADPRPPMPYLPFCVDVAEHAATLMWFVPALTAMLAVRHGLVKRGRRLFVEFLVWNGALLAVYGFILAGSKAAGPYGVELVNSIWKNRVQFFSTFGYPNMAGAYFAFLTALTVGLWRARVREVEMFRDEKVRRKDPSKTPYLWLRAHYLLPVAAVNFFGALGSLSRAAIISSFAVMLLTFIYIFAGVFADKRRERVRSVKNAAWAGLGMMVFLIGVYVFAPEGMSREMQTVSPLEVLDRVSGKDQYHSRVATAVFKDYPFFGTGGWGYRHFCRRYMTPEELKKLQMDGGANVHNDYLQFLCEYGVIGFGFLAAVFVLLLLPVIRDWYAFYHVSKFTRPGDAPITTLAIYSLPAPIFWIFTGTIIVLVEACGDCPLRSGAVFSAVVTALACADGFLPETEGARG